MEVKLDLTNHAKLMEKMAEVIKVTGNVEKKGTNKDQNYKFVTHSDIIQELRKHIAEKKLFILPKPKTYSLSEVVSRAGAKGSIITMHMNFEITDIETGYSIEVEWFGQGMDYGDKAMYKAYTGAFKYFLLDTFMISTGDDPENEAPEEKAAPKTYNSPSKTYAAPTLTVPQKKHIQDLLKQKGKTQEDLDHFVDQAFKITDWSTMTSAQASMIIKKLLSLSDMEKPAELEDVDTDAAMEAIDKMDAIDSPEKAK